jgi:hypothetical protein
MLQKIQKNRRRTPRMPRWQAQSTHIIFLLCAVSGLLYLLAHEFEATLLPVENHGLLVAHGVTAYLFVLLFGALMPNHIKSNWSNKRNRASGGLMVAVMSLLLVSGLFLYYGADTRDAALWVHWVIGGGLVLLFPLHYVIGKRADYLARKLH